MAVSALSYIISSYPVRCSCTGSNHDPNKQKLRYVGNSTKPAKVDLLSQTAGVASTLVASVADQKLYMNKVQVRQNIPTKKQFVDPYRQGLIIEGGVGYRQTVVIRSYEVGADKTATLESILNLLQNNLIWVVSRMQLQVDHYPIWGEIVEIDTWVGASGKNGMRRDWLIRSQATGHIFARATSTWVMMNEQTRRLSKMPEEVRAEISPWFIQKQAIKEDVAERINKLDNKAKYAISGLKPTRSDLDMNHHVNNVKYVRWMLENIPDQVVQSHQLSGIILEYRRECSSSSIVQSLCEPEEDGILKNGVKQDSSLTLLNEFSFPSEIMEGGGIIGSFEKEPVRYTHLLQIEGESVNEEIVRGKTTWKKKLPSVPFSS
ncbi:hypothetical protein EZV62_018590 [Acer yangbiense]|uniref:Acyl-[acyl-carrier-protein] hydrolase n=1 Tax=Acer yangbiense TaxID=1000413 RepID=A0A5C7HJT5_9ROSI|nr:hypothetical protein EZV62_018590 [Acer yangbiense]